MYCFVAIEEKVKGQIFDSIGVKQVKMLPILLAMVSQCKYN